MNSIESYEENCYKMTLVGAEILDFMDLCTINKFM